MNSTQRHALVFGAAGFVGRHLVLALTAQGVAVTAACRTEASCDGLTDWMIRHGCAHPPRTLLVDFDAPGCGIELPGHLDDVSEIYNCAAAFRFGMSEHEARHANVDSVRDIVGLAARLPQLRRLVHVTGYRVGGHQHATMPRNAQRTRHSYRTLGAYEASKIEADAVLREEANRLGVPWTVVNPSTVSGVADTGETDQYIGLAANFQDVWRGTLLARPGNADTFVPVIPVDYLARFMALLPTDPDTRGNSYWVLDNDTPALPDLLRIVGEHYRVPVPRARIPVAIIKRLPRALSKADPETLSFLSTDRYPTDQADAFAARHGLHTPATIPAIRRWADDLAAHRFGAVARTGLDRRFSEHAAVHTFVLGAEDATAVVLPGPPANADSWAAVAEALGDTAVVDLPGLGMSSGDRGYWAEWLDDLLAEGTTRHLIGHSVGAAAALDAAHRNPDRVEQLTLVAPSFLQHQDVRDRRAALLAAVSLRHASPDALSRRLAGSPKHAGALASSAADLRRPGVARRAGRLLRAATDRRWRTELMRQLTAFEGTIHVVVGSDDPLAPWAIDTLRTLGPRVRITTIADAGHHLHLTHPEDLARAIGSTTIESTEDARPGVRTRVGQA